MLWKSQKKMPEGAEAVGSVLPPEDLKLDRVREQVLRRVSKWYPIRLYQLLNELPCNISARELRKVLQQLESEKLVTITEDPSAPVDVRDAFALIKA